MNIALYDLRAYNAMRINNTVKLTYCLKLTKRTFYKKRKDVTMRILIVEDNPVDRKYLSRLLEGYGQCNIAKDGMEAINAFLAAFRIKDFYGLICINIMIPKIDGLTVLKRIRDIEIGHGLKNENRSKIIIITKYHNEYLKQASFEYGCNAYIRIQNIEKELAEILRDKNAG